MLVENDKRLLENVAVRTIPYTFVLIRTNPYLYRTKPLFIRRTNTH